MILHINLILCHFITIISLLVSNFVNLFTVSNLTFHLSFYCFPEIFGLILFSILIYNLIWTTIC